MCGELEETMNHLFFNYRIAWLVWSRCNLWLGMSMTLHGEAKPHFLLYNLEWDFKMENRVWGLCG